MNLLLGRLSDQLYDLDVAQALLVKGATERFVYTIAEHDSSYYRQEIYDLMESSIRIHAASDSIQSLIDAIGEYADTLSQEEEWGSAFDEWTRSILEAIDLGRARFGSLKNRAASRGLDILLDPSSPEAIALSCRIGEIAPGLETMEEFITEANEEEWRTYLPTLPACVLDDWRRGWAGFVRAQIETMSAAERPFWGPIGLYHMDEILGSEPGWDRASLWGENQGALRIEWGDSATAGSGLAVLLACGGELSGSYYHPFLMRSPPSIEPVPAGAFRVLLFLSGYHPVVSETIAVSVGETTTWRAEPTPLGGEDCVLTGGDVDLWVVDPSSDEHINNDFNVPCDTEVWEGEVLFQIRHELDSLDHGFIVRTTVPLRFEVDCVDRSLRGGGTGEITLLPGNIDGYVLGDIAPDSVRLDVSGARYQTEIEIAINRDPVSYYAVVAPPGGTPEQRDVSNQVFPGYSTRIQLGSAQRAEIRSPSGADETSPFFFHLTLDRIF